MIKNLYDKFANDWYSAKGSIWIISDPHFSDEDAWRFRFPEEFDMDDLDGVSEATKRTAARITVEHCDQMLIDNINRVCNKNDTLIILGDVGNIECVKKLKAGYKVLILGNHDRGASYYKHIENYTELKDEESADEVFTTVFGQRFAHYDNKLFDEVYEGTLQIGPKIILSHEPVDYKYCLNIHGHYHSVNLLGAYTEKLGENLQPCGGWYNCCAEQIDYTPINLQALIKSGIFKHIPDIHRETIDKAVKEKKKWIMNKVPKIYNFRTQKAKIPYIIEKRHRATAMDVAISKLFAEAVPDSKILVEGEEYIDKIVPYGYFRYKKQIWPVYVDDAGQQDMIYLNGEFVGGGTFNFNSVEEFIWMIDHSEAK